MEFSHYDFNPPARLILFCWWDLKVLAQVFSPDDKKKPFLTVEGEWNGLMTGKWADGRTEKFVDVKRLDITKKRARRVADQEMYESRRMWKDVTVGLK